MDRSSQYISGSENKEQYPTEDELVDPYFNDAYLQDYGVGVPREDQGRHHDDKFYPSQEEQELEQRGRHLQEWDPKPQDEAMDQNPGSLGAVNPVDMQSGRPSSFDPRGLFSQIPEMDKEGVHTGREGGALQPPARLELAGVGRHGSLYYRAASPGRSPGRSPRRTGAIHQSNSRYRVPQIPEEEADNPSYPTDQVESGDHGHRDRPTPGQSRLDQQRASEAGLYDGNRQPREEAPVNTMGDARIHTSLAAKSSSIPHSLAGQAARSQNYQSVPEILQPGIAHNPQAAPAVPGSESMGRPISSSISPESQRYFHPQEQRTPAPGSHVSSPLQKQEATVPHLTPQRPSQPGLQPQRQDHTASMPGNRSRSPQRTPPQMQQRVPVTPDPTRYSQGVQSSAPIPSPSHRPTDLHSSQARQSAVPRPEIPQSTLYGQQGSTPPQMAGPQHAQDPHQRAAQQQQQDRPPAMVSSQKDQHPNRKPVPQAGRPSQSGPARTQEAAVQHPLSGQESYQQHGMQQQQQQQRQPLSSRLQQDAPSAAPYDKVPRPEGFQQPRQSVPGNSSTAPMINQQGSKQQAHPPPLHEMAPSAPFHDLKATSRPQRGQQSNEPLTQAYGAVEPVMTPQQQQPPAEPYRRQQNLTRSSPPPPAAMSPSQRPLAPARTPASISKESVPDVQIPPSSSSTQPPAQRRAPLRTKPRETPSPAPLTGESLLSTLVQGRPVPRLDARDPKHGSALVQGPYCIL